VPSLDEENPATLSKRIVQGLLREELGYQGVILSDDLEMKAIARSFTPAEAAVRAIAAGCDGVLICRALTDDRGADIDVQAEVLEALVRAVESGELPYRRVEDALTRQRRAKERFLTAPVAPAPASALRRVIGCDQHQQIADEMARFL
jgi:beta-N-acetylhexosaminidase